MDVVYATLIIYGKRTFEQVPMSLKERTRKCLEDLGMGELAKEEA
ncbi:MAG: CD1375 family protein [Peptoniphilus grossensis]|nr:CD1375 family protein [Peptoniphilus grossensis]MDU5099271.1 CD1375 family protein [Peptoniphilus grossensis]